VIKTQSFALHKKRLKHVTTRMRRVLRAVNASKCVCGRSWVSDSQSDVGPIYITRFLMRTEPSMRWRHCDKRPTILGEITRFSVQITNGVGLRPWLSTKSNFVESTTQRGLEMGGILLFKIPS